MELPTLVEPRAARPGLATQTTTTLPWRALVAALALHLVVFGFVALAALSCTGWRTLFLFTPWPDALGRYACQRSGGEVGGKPMEAVFVQMPSVAVRAAPPSPAGVVPKQAVRYGVEKAVIAHSTAQPKSVPDTPAADVATTAPVHSTPITSSTAALSHAVAPAPGLARGDSPQTGPDRDGHATAMAYQVALVRAILQHWVRPAGMAQGAHCQISITQQPGGKVLSVMPLAGCTFDLAGWRAIELAVAQASPLPYSGFESDFHRVITLRFALKAQ